MIVKVFDEDVKKFGSYAYTQNDCYSAIVANKRQTDETIAFLKTYFKNNISILDLGCGDGTYTIELYKKIKPRKIIGSDPSINGIKAARRKVDKLDKNRITFKVEDIYDVDEIYKNNNFDVVILRGVLHHLEYPQKAIKKMSLVFNKILIIEPNGFNPLLKIIEKLSPYHREHKERSYWPPLLNSWFITNGYTVKSQKFFLIVPFFCNEYLARILNFCESFFEKIPFIKRFYCSTNIILYEKKP